MKKKINLNLPKLIGHRGVKNLCPENTLESISKAFDLGLTCVEIDVKITKDLIPILLHDDTLDRTTTGKGLVVDFDYSILKKLDAGKFFYKKNTNIFIPKLIDVLHLCKNRKGALNIELKPNKDFEKINVLKVFEVVKDVNDVDIFFSSFNLISFEKISKIFPESNRSFLIDSFDEYSIYDLIRILKYYNANICGLNINILSDDIIRILKENEILITVYSDKSILIEKAEECFRLGVDSIFVDDPLELPDKF